MGDLIQFRDYQSKAAIERAHKALEEHFTHETNQIMNEALFGVPGFPIDYDPRFYPGTNPKDSA